MRSFTAATLRCTDAAQHLAALHEGPRADLHRHGPTVLLPDVDPERVDRPIGARTHHHRGVRHGVRRKDIEVRPAEEELRVGGGEPQGLGGGAVHVDEAPLEVVRVDDGVRGLQDGAVIDVAPSPGWRRRALPRSHGVLLHGAPAERQPETAAGRVDRTPPVGGILRRGGNCR